MSDLGYICATHSLKVKWWPIWAKAFLPKNTSRGHLRQMLLCLLLLAFREGGFIKKADDYFKLVVSDLWLFVHKFLNIFAN